MIGVTERSRGAAEECSPGRKPWVNLFAHIGGIIREMRATAVIVNGTADHVHVLARIRPIHSAAEIVRIIKANSSRWVHEKWGAQFAWQAGYGVFSVSDSQVSGTIRYIADQEKHHAKRSFEDEFLAFLKKNHVVYNERYLWD